VTEQASKLSVVNQQVIWFRWLMNTAVHQDPAIVQSF